MDQNTISELTVSNMKENMIAWAMEHLDRREYIGWVKLERVLAQKPF